jgi:glycosyltransferase involved in cell wall biosynthesis
MEISILVTVKNDLNNTKVLISSLKKLGKDFEIVVVDAYSTDGTYEYLQSETDSMGLILSRKEGKRSVGRNECIRLSSGKKLVFLDSDAEITATWELALKKQIFRDILAGKIMQERGAIWSDLERVPILYKGRDVTFPSNNLMYSRTVIEEIGNFDERFNTAEDIDLNIRAIENGYEIFYDENVVISHHPRQSYWSMLKQSYNDGIGRRLIREKYGLRSSFNKRNLRRHPLIETTRLASGMVGYLFGG